MQSNSKKKRTRHISVIVRVAVAILAVGLFFRGENLAELYNGIRSINPLVFLAAVGLYCLGQCIFVFRWRLLLKVLSIDIKFTAGLKLHMLGLFYNNCLPGGVGGDLLRAWYVTKHAADDKRFEAAISVFVDRAVGLLGMLIMAGGFYWLFPVSEVISQEASDQSQTESGIGAIIGWISSHNFELLAVFVAFLLLFAGFLIVKRTRDLLLKSWNKLWVLGLKILGEIIAAAKLYCRRPLMVAGALFLTFLCQGIPIFGFYLLGRDLGASVSIKYYYVFFPLSWLIGTLPISIGGLGVIEGWLKMAFKSVGVLSRTAALIALCQRLVMLVGSLPGIFIHIFGAHLPSQKEMAAVSDEDAK